MGNTLTLFIVSSLVLEFLHCPPQTATKALLSAGDCQHQCSLGGRWEKTPVPSFGWCPSL